MSEYNKYTNYSSNKKKFKTKGVTVRFTDYSGNDLSHTLTYSYIYNGVPGGWSVSNTKSRTLIRDYFNKRN